MALSTDAYRQISRHEPSANCRCHESHNGTYLQQARRSSKTGHQSHWLCISGVTYVAKDGLYLSDQHLQNMTAADTLLLQLRCREMLQVMGIDVDEVA